MIAKLYRSFCRLEDVLLVALLLTLILLSASQIFLRNLADAGWPWVDPLVRAGVMWLAMLGASVASRSQRHITVDIVARAVPDTPKRVLESISSLVAALICGYIAWLSWVFLQDEITYASDWILGLPSWVPVLILPYGFAMISLRYAAAIFGWREREHV